MGFPKQNTGVGFHFLLQGVFLIQELNPHLLHWQVDFFTTEPPGKPLKGGKLVVESLSRVQLFVTPWTVAHQAPLSMGFPGKSTGVGCHFLFQGIFPTQGSNPGLPHCRQTLYHLSHQGSLKGGYLAFNPGFLADCSLA